MLRAAVRRKRRTEAGAGRGADRDREDCRAPRTNRVRCFRRGDGLARRAAPRAALLGVMRSFVRRSVRKEGAVGPQRFDGAENVSRQPAASRTIQPPVGSAKWLPITKTSVFAKSSMNA